MRYYLLFVFFILFNTKNVWAEIGLIGLDTSIDKSDYKQSKQYFLEHYAHDDTSKALVNYFFKKRGHVLTDAIPLVISGSLFLITQNHNHTPTNVKDNYYPLVILAPLAFAVTGSVILLVNNEVIRVIFTKRKLFKLLNNYNQQKHLPKRITRKREFQLELDKLQGKPRKFRLF